jgi:triosephosphate isomerase
MRRIPFVAGNWKMYTTARTGRDLAAAVARGVCDDRVRVAVCPPYPYLALIGEVLQGSRVALGAQNLYPSKEGAFTGEVSPAMLVDVGCQYVIVGHSERRHGLGEKDSFINQKVKSGLNVGLGVILCVGETLDEREAGRTEALVEEQLSAGLAGVDLDQLPQVVIAYEPVWAIGTGRNATPEQAQAVHAVIRRRFASHFGDESAQMLTIQYGGSVKADNAAALMAQPDVDGALVGGASLQAETFLAIVNAARA